MANADACRASIEEHITIRTDAAAPAVRYRSRTGLRRLEVSSPASTLFAAAEARNDRLKLTARARIKIPDDVDPLDYVSAIAPFDELGLFATDIPAPGATRFKLRTRFDQRRPIWLMSAMGYAKWVAGAGFFDIELELDANPTRFLAHQPDPHVPAICARDPFDALRVNPAVAEAVRLVTLDGSDNVLLSRDQLGGSTFNRREQLWATVLAAYLAHLSAALTATLCPDGLSAEMLTPVALSVRQAEVYWEMSTPDAISTIGALCQSMKTADIAARLSRRSEIGGAANAEWVNLDLTNEVTAKLYAKTAARIRVEVTYYDRAAQYAARSGAGIAAGIVRVLGALARDAASRTQQLWSTLVDLHALHSEAGDICDLMAKLNAAVPEVNRRLILSLLANHRSLTQTSPEGFASQHVCRALAKAGVLSHVRVRNRNAPRYTLSPAYSVMFDRLLGRDDAMRPLPN